MQMGNKTFHNISLATSYLLLGKKVLLTCHFKFGRKARSQFQVYRIIFTTWGFSVPSIPTELWEGRTLVVGVHPRKMDLTVLTDEF